MKQHKTETVFYHSKHKMITSVISLSTARSMKKQTYFKQLANCTTQSHIKISVIVCHLDIEIIYCDE
jgi:hypothetical protein